MLHMSQMSAATAAEIGSRNRSVDAYCRRKEFLERRLLPRFSPQVHQHDLLHTEGPLVILMSHQNFLDPPLMAALSKRHLRTIYRWGGLAGYGMFPKFMAVGGAIPARRGDAKDSPLVLAVIKQLLQEDRCVFIFPEGTRTPGDKIGDLHPRVIDYLNHPRVKYVCVGASGTTDWKKNSKPTLWCEGPYAFTDLQGDNRRQRLVSLTGQMQEVKTAAIDLRRNTLQETVGNG